MSSQPVTGLGWTPPPHAEERRLSGRSARQRTPRSAHAEFTTVTGREDFLIELEAQAARRLPSLNPVRFGRMLDSPFAFFRGAAAIMAADLAGTPVSGLVAQLCGDAHLLNFGLYASPERHLVFDLNDFDETAPGPWEWDVKRLAASVEIAGRDRALAESARDEAVRSTVGAYRQAMRSYARMRHLEVWYEHRNVDDVTDRSSSTLDKKTRSQLLRETQKARSRDSDRLAGKLTEVHDGTRVFVSAPPLLEPLRDILSQADRADHEDRLSGIFAGYLESLQPDRRWLLQQFRCVDLARKAVGIGSVGTRCWVALLVGRDDDDLLVLQLKEANQSVLAPHLGHDPAEHDGRRVVEGQRQMQAVTDILLGWQRTEGLDGISRDFYVRQLADWKGGVDVEGLGSDSLLRYGEACGRTLARAHARSGDRFAIAGYLGTSDTFDRALAVFARAYANQNASDHAVLADAVASGRITATNAG